MTTRPMIPLRDFPDPAVTQYVSNMTAVCPFIDPAVRVDQLRIAEVTLDCQEAGDVHPRMFEQIVPRVEAFRRERLQEPDPRRRLLLCHNLLFRLPAHLDAETSRLLVWPNWLSWILKRIYTSKAIVFGFFYKGSSHLAADGTPIPVAPEHLIVLRSALTGVDHRFFRGNSQFMEALKDGDDDGSNAHRAAGLMECDLTDPQAMRAAVYYEHVLKWARDSFAKQ